MIQHKAGNDARAVSTCDLDKPPTLVHIDALLAVELVNEALRFYCTKCVVYLYLLVLGRIYIAATIQRNIM